MKQENIKNVVDFLNTPSIIGVMSNVTHPVKGKALVFTIKFTFVPNQIDNIPTLEDAMRIAREKFFTCTIVDEKGNIVKYFEPFGGFRSF